MALLQSIRLEHLPASHVLHVALFHSVSNASFLHQQLLDGNAEFEYAFIDASVVRAANSFCSVRCYHVKIHTTLVLQMPA
jgi:hypothetical protein